MLHILNKNPDKYLGARAAEPAFAEAFGTMLFQSGRRVYTRAFVFDKNDRFA